MRIKNPEVLYNLLAEHPKHAKYMHLDHTQVESLKGIKECSSLIDISLKGNKLQEINDDVKYCRQLWRINFAHNMISNVNGLHSFSVLGFVDLSFNDLSFQDLFPLRIVHIFQIRLIGNFNNNKKSEEYREQVINILPNVWVLDDYFITSEEKQRARKNLSLFPDTQKLIQEYDKTHNLDSSSVEMGIVTGLYEGKNGSKGEYSALAKNRIEYTIGKYADYGLSILSEQPPYASNRDSYRLKTLARLYEIEVKRHNSIVKAQKGKEFKRKGNPHPPKLLFPSHLHDCILKLDTESQFNIIFLLATATAFSIPSNLLISALVHLKVKLKQSPGISERKMEDTFSETFLPCVSTAKAVLAKGRLKNSTKIYSINATVANDLAHLPPFALSFIADSIKHLCQTEETHGFFHPTKKQLRYISILDIIIFNKIIPHQFDSLSNIKEQKDLKECQNIIFCQGVLHLLHSPLGSKIRDAINNKKSNYMENNAGANSWQRQYKAFFDLLKQTQLMHSNNDAATVKEDQTSNLLNEPKKDSYFVPSESVTHQYPLQIGNQDNFELTTAPVLHTLPHPTVGSKVLMGSISNSYCIVTRLLLHEGKVEIKAKAADTFGAIIFRKELIWDPRGWWFHTKTIDTIRHENHTTKVRMLKPVTPPKYYFPDDDTNGMNYDRSNPNFRKEENSCLSLAPENDLVENNTKYLSQDFCLNKKQQHEYFPKNRRSLSKFEEKRSLYQIKCKEDSQYLSMFLRANIAEIKKSCVVSQDILNDLNESESGNDLDSWMALQKSMGSFKKINRYGLLSKKLKKHTTSVSHKSRAFVDIDKVEGGKSIKKVEKTLDEVLRSDCMVTKPTVDRNIERRVQIRNVLSDIIDKVKMKSLSWEEAETKNKLANETRALLEGRHFETKKHSLLSLSYPNDIYQEGRVENRIHPSKDHNQTTKNHKNKSNAEQVGDVIPIRRRKQIPLSWSPKKWYVSTGNIRYCLETPLIMLGFEAIPRSILEKILRRRYVPQPFLHATKMLQQQYMALSLKQRFIAYLEAKRKKRVQRRRIRYLDEGEEEGEEKERGSEEILKVVSNANEGEFSQLETTSVLEFYKRNDGTLPILKPSTIIKEPEWRKELRKYKKHQRLHRFEGIIGERQLLSVRKNNATNDAELESQSPNTSAEKASPKKKVLSVHLSVQDKIEVQRNSLADLNTADSLPYLSSAASKGDLDEEGSYISKHSLALLSKYVKSISTNKQEDNSEIQAESKENSTIGSINHERSNDILPLPLIEAAVSPSHIENSNQTTKDEGETEYVDADFSRSFLSSVAPDKESRCQGGSKPAIKAASSDLHHGISGQKAILFSSSTGKYYQNTFVPINGRGVIDGNIYQESNIRYDPICMTDSIHKRITISPKPSELSLYSADGPLEFDDISSGQQRRRSSIYTNGHSIIQTDQETLKEHQDKHVTIPSNSLTLYSSCNSIDSNSLSSGNVNSSTVHSGERQQSNLISKESLSTISNEPSTISIVGLASVI